MIYTVIVRSEPVADEEKNVLRFVASVEFIQSMVEQLQFQLRRGVKGSHIVFHTRGNISVEEMPE
jgi:hypothetical protein